MASAAADWDLFQSLHAVMQAGSFSGAARARGLTQPTLGRHIEALEQKLGGALFLRSPRGLQPTELALALAPHLEDMAATAAAALRDAAGPAEGASGCVRLTASEVLAVEVLPPILGEFMEDHPEIEIELAVSNEVEDLLRREADIAIRMARPTQQALVARKVGSLLFGFYATPGYLQRRGVPTSFDDLESHTMVGFDRIDPKAIVDKIDIGRPISRELFKLKTDNQLAQVAAIRAGLGIGAVQHGLARRDGLVPLLANAFSFELEIWICMHESLKASRRMRLMSDHLADRLRAFVAESQPA
jgi:DNA-binding transcriptional LysR family regulator